MAIPRIRMFAGPNGSGKSTLKQVVPDHLIGLYINADEIEAEIRESDSLELERFNLSEDSARLVELIVSNSRLSVGVDDIQIRNGALHFGVVSEHAYLASVISEVMRQLLLEKGASFTFETVMSHPSKVEFLEKARVAGYRTYLYYVATEDPEINIGRVAYRVTQKGHDVPKDKIVSRYTRSLELLLSAIKVSSRAYLFDNSGAPGEQTWFAEVTDGDQLEFRTTEIPAWFKEYVLKRL